MTSTERINDDTADRVPLSRNRAYTLLWVSRALTETGFAASMIAFPLLVLAVTGSPAATGLVTAANAAAQLVAGLPAGALADRLDRRRIMIGCELARILALGSLVTALLFDLVTVVHMVAVAVVLGVCSALFEPAEEASLPNVVRPDQLPTALAMNGVRGFVGHLAGTSLGGLLFGVRRFVPFLFDLVTHAVSAVLLMFVRLPPTQQPKERAGLRKEIGEGLRWIWGQPLIRATALCSAGLNLLFQALFVMILVIAQQRGLPSGEIGVMAAMLGVGGLLGSLVAPTLCRVVRPYLSIIGVCWGAALLTPVLVLPESGYVIGAVFAAIAFLAPTANTTVNTYQMLLTPDDRRGRMSGLMNLVAGLSAAVGPALGGVLLELLPGTHAILLCAGAMALLSLAATVSPVLRSFPVLTGEKA